VEYSSEVNWHQDVWDEINNAIKMEMGKVRIAQKVFSTMTFEKDDCPTEVPNDVINFLDPDGFSIKEGSTKPFVEIYHEFPLTHTQVCKEPQLKTCKTLSRMAAKTLALAEDTIFFQGNRGRLPGNVLAAQRESTANGLLGEASPQDANNEDSNKVTIPIQVARLQNSLTGALWGENTASAIAKGISLLTSKGQAKDYALFLPTDVHADIYVPSSPASPVTPADRIIPMVEGGLYTTGTLSVSPLQGLLVALAGDPTMLYVGREAAIEFVRKEGSKYFFRVVERVQYVARDPRALVLLNFEQEVVPQ
jgi:uncharacterized linocin/CFP29 family protein